MQRGFTIIECIAVLLILSVLAYFVVPRFIHFDRNAQAVEEQYKVSAEARKDIYNQYLGVENE